MMYPFMTLEDGTEVVHSDIKEDGRVEVYIEKPDENTVFVMLHAGSQIMIGGCLSFFSRGYQQIRRNYKIHSAFDYGIFPGRRI